MAILHAAEVSPTKAEMMSAWLPRRSWAPADGGPLEMVGAYRFDDPEGRVGMEVHLVRWGGPLLQVPLTYRDAPLDGADRALLGPMQHSVLGDRWVYDGLGDPVFTAVLAGVTMTGCGQALGMVHHGGRWVVVPTPVRLSGGGGSGERVAVDQLIAGPDEDQWAVLRNDRFELRWSRCPVAGERPPIGLRATWPGQDDPVVLAEVRDLTA